MTEMLKLQDIETEMGMLLKQLEHLQSEQAKLLEKEGSLRTQLQSLQNKKDRLTAGS